MTRYSEEYYAKYKASIIKAVLKYKAKNKDKVKVWQSKSYRNRKAKTPVVSTEVPQ